MPHPFKRLRVAVALVVFVGLTAALVDFRGLVPTSVGRWLASTQFTPSLVALATGTTLSVACLVIIVATLIAGRVYCAAICPLGILQDGLARMANAVRRKGPRRLPYARPQIWLRRLFFWGTVGGVAAGWAGFTLALVDPYSNYGRIAADLFRPLLTLANNAVAGLANFLGVGTLFRVEPHWAGGGALHQPLLALALLIVLAALRGRLYCNTLCPLGVLLGWLARHAAFRLAIDPDTCNKCADCLQACKAQCIDLRQKTIDFSRCVTCYNCLGTCSKHVITYRFAWARRSRRGTEPQPLGAALAVPDPQRRAFLAGAATGLVAALSAPRLLASAPSIGRTAADTSVDEAGEPETSAAICPPGARSVDRFLDRCTACHLCVSACPTQVLEPAFMEYGLAGVMKPRLDYTRGACTYTCRTCSEVCPTGAIDRLELADKQLVRIGEARLNLDLCIVKTKGTDCAACSEQCPTQAVTTVPYGNNLRLPQYNRDLCTGCGGCEFACPVQPRKAITVIGHRRHGRAKQPADQKAVAPPGARDFPF